MQLSWRHISKKFTWYADQDSPDPDGEQKIHSKTAMYKQRHLSKQIVRITLNTVQDLNLPIDYKGDRVTLHQALACCITSGMGNYRSFVAVCVNNYKDEAQSIIKNLTPLCCEHFGEAVKIWLTPDVWQANTHRVYNRQIQMVEEDVSFKNDDGALLVSYFGDDLG